MIVESYSWTIVDENTAIERTDHSLFNNGVTGIPIQIRFFFEVDNMEPGSTKNVTLVLNDKQYNAKIHRDNASSKRTRMSWEKQLTNCFNSLFQFVVKTKKYPELIFEKNDSCHYTLSFRESHFETGDDDSRDNYLENYVYEPDTEGKKKVIYTTTYERSKSNRDAAIQLHGTICSICGFDFEKTYGEIGRGFIEVHHIKPLFSKEEEVTVDPKNDLICICSNCHRMIHRRKDKIVTPEELKQMVINRR